ncbi:WD repeat-containing protein 17 [Armadillidium vulgare]|nr:WD repeat-containing protein 17 [Armadillidium vulgare]
MDNNWTLIGYELDLNLDWIFLATHARLSCQKLFAYQILIRLYFLRCRESCFCFVHQVGGPNGILVQGYKHPGPVYGCDWKDGSILATGCEDGKIRIFNVNKSGKEPLVELKAHQQKVFGVKWNPVYSDILCSGSDDTSIKIWSFSKAQCLSVLVGHSDNVRGLIWCPEIPSLLISGSWDRTMRVWDAQSCSCLDVIFDHRADIYGLSIHPIRPFLLASCSRDSTVRLWSLSSLVSPLHLKVLAERPLEEIIAEKVPEGSRDTADVHIRNLWDLVYVLQGNNDISSLSPQYSSSIVHHSHLFKCIMSSASEMEESLGKSKGYNIRKASIAAENIDALAGIYLSIGAIQHYCELMTRIKKWDHALALAPAVSVDYWRQLIQRKKKF